MMTSQWKNKYTHEQANRLNRMGIVSILLGIGFSLGAYLIPIATISQQGVYVLSGLFVFFGLYCLGAVWRKQNFI